ncbi:MULTISPECIES: hypothetical protein [Actinomadura]|uniref:VWFA domain-containing protein n=1 Tax=Actinomadura madurae TaxID=1993 RepID=A0A1I5MG47_9ACTN|nr:hypothetical protein [Actinomadura madurae]URM97555.1 hypothetical protein LUW76_26110 [Actinomadura madurae]URN08246.1 hypothetical protein LUW74_35990 [Actinomadura madurae]SFP08562.1 hypothetical protein SAMN04489713_111284 [Actinomadura madurae]SPT60884.1 Uncharacterised protein [Actinomadura madurae]
MYEAEINRATPTCMVFLLDQSASMKARIGGGSEAKQQVVADSLNHLLGELINRCVRQGDIYDFFHIGVISYGRTVGPALGGALGGGRLVTSSELAHHPLRVENRRIRRPGNGGGFYEYDEEVPIWVDAAAEGLTPMTRALEQTHDLLKAWVDENPRSYPPIVLNMTDGEATDGDPARAGERIRSLTTHDGGALLFNLHISSKELDPVRFPAADGGLPKSGRRLFGMSSRLPERMRLYADAELGLEVSQGSRGFVYNADIASIIHFLDVGTRPVYHRNGAA